MEYSQEVLNELGQKIDLVEYASHTVDFVKTSGNVHFAICPFHSEKTASLAVYEDTQTYYCYGCGSEGNIFTWIQLTENLSFKEAVRKVAALSGSEISESVESEIFRFYKKYSKLVSSTNKAYPERPILNIEKDYKEKYSDEVPQEWIEEGISEEEIKKYEIRIDKGSNRIVYPVYDSNYNLIGVKGRTRSKNYKNLNIMKYMNYNSLGGRVDFFTGMKQAELYVKEKNEIVILEGLKSVMKVDGWGYHNAVSVETSTLNELQIELIIQMHIKDVVLAFDKDVPISKIKDHIGLLNRFTNCYAIIDKWKLLNNKDSPCDRGKDVWDTLYERRVRI